MRAAVRWLSVATTFGMWLVLLMGALVTSTGSSQGCGRSWPLCNGQFIPELALTSLVEYSHRAVTGVIGLLVLGFAVSVWTLYWRHRELRVLAGVMLGTLVFQSGLGAAAVLWPQTPAVLATHFGISLVCFTSVVLIAMLVRQIESGVELRDVAIPTRLRWMVWGITGYVLIVVYSGAYVRHVKYSLGCVGWPLCNGQLLPPFESEAAGVAFAHRLAALAAVLMLSGLFLWARRLQGVRPDLYGGSAAALGLVLLQALSGALVNLTYLSLWSTLMHAGIMGLLAGALGYLCLQALPRRAARSEMVTAARASRPSEARPLS